MHRNSVCGVIFRTCRVCDRNTSADQHERRQIACGEDILAEHERGEQRAEHRNQEAEQTDLPTGNLPKSAVQMVNAAADSTIM